MVPVLLRVRDPAWKAPRGVRVQSRLGNIVSASAPLKILEELRSDQGIVSIDLSREGGILELATSKAFVHATTVHQPPIDEKGAFCRLRLTLNHRDNGDNLLVITIEPDGSSIQGGIWTLRLLGKTILSPGAGVVHAWVERHQSRAVAFNSGDNDEMTLSVPGTANHVITVAACGSAVPLMLTSSSSWGLTRDHRPKPDLVAPGTAVVAARANTGDHQATMAMTGTSMAAPHVTGSVALVLSKRHKDGGTCDVGARSAAGSELNSESRRLLEDKFSHTFGVGKGSGLLARLTPRR